MGPFVTLWNNNIENVVDETMLHQLVCRCGCWEARRRIYLDQPRLETTVNDNIVTVTFKAMLVVTYQVSNCLQWKNNNRVNLFHQQIGSSLSTCCVQINEEVFETPLAPVFLIIVLLRTRAMSISNDIILIVIRYLPQISVLKHSSNACNCCQNLRRQTCISQSRIWQTPACICIQSMAAKMWLGRYQCQINSVAPVPMAKGPLTKVSNQTSFPQSTEGPQCTAIPRRSLWNWHMTTCALRMSGCQPTHGVQYTTYILSPRCHFLICWSLLIINIPIPRALSVGFIIHTLEGFFRNSSTNRL